MSTMEDVCVHALARLVRLRLADVRAGMPARSMLQQRMREAIQEDDTGGLAALDDILERTAQEARRRLTGLMPDPPASDPVGQLLLLRAAVAARPDLWDGLQVAGGMSPDVIAAALDLPAGSVPEIYLQRLAREHPAFAAGHFTTPCSCLPRGRAP